MAPGGSPPVPPPRAWSRTSSWIRGTRSRPSWAPRALRWAELASGGGTSRSKARNGSFLPRFRRLMQDLSEKRPELLQLAPPGASRRPCRDHAARAVVRLHWYRSYRGPSLRFWSDFTGSELRLLSGHESASTEVPQARPEGARLRPAPSSLRNSTTGEICQLRLQPRHGRLTRFRRSAASLV
jgi:hypothetical protein